MRLKNPTIWLAFFVACYYCLSATPLSAQVLSPAESNSFAQPSYDIVNDVFIGKGSKGPYMLTWKNIEAESETVLVGGRRLSRGSEYTIDYTSGIVAFTEPLPDSSIAKISYKKVPKKSASNTSGMSLPMNARLIDSDRGSMDLMGFHRAGDSKSPGVSVFGLSGTKKLKEGTDFSSMFLFSQSNDSDPNRKEHSLLDQSVMKFGTSTKIGALSLQGSMLKVGEHFAGAKEYGMQPSKEQIDLSGTFGKTTDAIFASFSYRQDEPGDDKKPNQTLSDQKVVVNMNDMGKLSLSRSTVEAEALNGSITDNESSSLLYEKSFGQNTSASASLQRTETTTGGVTSQVEKARLHLQSRVAEGLQLRGGLFKDDSTYSGEESGYDVGLNLSLNKRTSLDASFRQVDSEKNGTLSTTAVSMTSSALRNIQLQTSLVMNNSDVSGAQTKMNIGLKAIPMKNTSLEAVQTTTDSEAAGQSTHTTVKLSTSPLDGLHLSSSMVKKDNQGVEETGIDVGMKARMGGSTDIEGSFREKSVENGVDEEQHNVRLTAKPADYVKLSAGLSAKTVGDLAQESRDARIEIKPNDKLSLATAYAESDDGRTVVTVRNYSGSLKPGSHLELSGAFKSREYSTSQEDLNTSSLRLALGRPKMLRITGQYDMNPEDQKGVVQRITSASVGLELKLGIMGITGGYAESEEYLLDRMSRETRLALGIPMFGNGNLTTSYKISEALGGIEQSTTTYSLGYTHIIGSSFNLSLAGELTKFERDSLCTGGEYKATAKIGMSF